MRVAIYGAGSLGTILGAYISRAGVDIELINRNKAHVEALQKDGACVVGTVEFSQKVIAYTPDAMSGKYDIVFLMTKQQHNTEVVNMLKGYLAADGVLVTFQNGLPEMQIAGILGDERVLGCTFGEAAGPKESRRVVQALIKECIDVCAAGGIRIEPVQGKDIVKLLNYTNAIKKAFSFFIIPIAIRKHAKLKASMLQDLEKGKLTEVDAINGAVSEYGRKVGCPTPANDRVVEIIHRIERGELSPCSENLKFFK